MVPKQPMRLVNVTIQHVADGPAGEISKVRILAVLDFVMRDGNQNSYILPSDPVAVDEQSSLVIHATYSPGNNGLGVFVAHRTANGDKHVFTGGGCWASPPYYAFRLPTGQFIELYFERDMPELRESKSKNNKPE